MRNNPAETRLARQTAGDCRVLLRHLITPAEFEVLVDPGDGAVAGCGL